MFQVAHDARMAIFHVRMFLVLAMFSLLVSLLVTHRGRKTAATMLAEYYPIPLSFGPLVEALAYRDKPTRRAVINALSRILRDCGDSEYPELSGHKKMLLYRELQPGELPVVHLIALIEKVGDAHAVP